MPNGGPFGHEDMLLAKVKELQEVIGRNTQRIVDAGFGCKPNDESYLLTGAVTLVLAELKDLVRLKAGIRESDIWADDWCPVCQEHPSHDHGGKDCPMKKP